MGIARLVAYTNRVSQPQPLVPASCWGVLLLIVLLMRNKLYTV